ncbi:MAG: isoprenylcysteine carboxylmethyltransferase family protein [Endomicrobiaceae bacterium]|jgi:protein-S-isoprenylcysteine O-methyltransferase Ste14|nr:isoprenylcysteine carboxylmethyltransferase family protein [Endomicrobiaceae bacterium]MDD4166453.1 isoprenylcysteine carboxylmethyltransferase family protein [Endomicrobiaceae bacterium]
MNKKTLNLIQAVILLPFMVICVIPALILLFTKFRIIDVSIMFFVALVLFLIGIFFAVWTVYLFWSKGNGTPGPWAPPINLVIEGPYKYTRNPMITSVLFMLLALSIFFLSFGIFIWFIIFLAVNIIYLRLVEEKKLKIRFGEEYIKYNKSVPMWIPSLKPYKKQ